MRNKKHLSASQINMYLRCPAQYFFRYIEGLKRPPGAALTLGAAVDDGLNFDYNQKIQSRKNLKVAAVLDAYSTSFDVRRKDTEWQRDEKPAEIKDQGAGLIQSHHKKIATSVQPRSVQEQLIIPFENFDFDYIGYVDIIEEKEIIIDNKTAGKSPARDIRGKYHAPANDDLQMSLYALGYRLKYHKPEKGCQFHYMIKKKEPDSIRVLADRTNEMVDFGLRMIGYVADAIKKEVFYPNRSNYMCSGKWCGYYQICHKQM